MAIIETGAEDHLIKMDEKEIAIIPINNSSDRDRVGLLLDLNNEILLVYECWNSQLE
jgi:hypothetical protein